jgi:hypothetical protein
VRLRTRPMLAPGSDVRALATLIGNQPTTVKRHQCNQLRTFFRINQLKTFRRSAAWPVDAIMITKRFVRNYLFIINVPCFLCISTQAGLGPSEFRTPSSCRIAITRYLYVEIE